MANRQLIDDWEDEGDWEDIPFSTSKLSSSPKTEDWETIPISKTEDFGEIGGIEFQPKAKPKVEEKRSIYEHMFNAPESVTKAARGFAESLTPSNPSSEAGIVDAIKGIPDIARNMFSNPLETIKGFVGGATEGAASQLSPANILTLGRGRLPNLAAKILGGAQALHGGGEILQGNTAEGIGDVAFGALSGISGFQGGGKLGKIADDVIAPPKPKSPEVILPTAKNRLTELVAKNLDDLTPQEIREVVRLKGQLDKVGKIKSELTPEVSRDVDLTSNPTLNQPKPLIENSPELLDESGRPLGTTEANPPIIQNRPPGPWDENFSAGTPIPERVIPPIRPDNPAVTRMKAIEERLNSPEVLPEIDLPVTSLTKQESNPIDIFKSRVEEELAKFEISHASDIPGFRKPGNPNKIVIPETGMTELDIEDLRSIRHNRSRQDAMPKISDGKYSDEWLKAFPHLKDDPPVKITGWGEDIVGIESKSGRNFSIDRKHLKNVAVPIGKDYGKNSTRGNTKTVMNPKRFDNEGNFIPQNKQLEAKPTAKFVGHQEDMEGGSIPLYNIEGGPSHGSTVSSDKLNELGIDIPDTPQFTGQREIPSDIREILSKSGLDDEAINSIPFDEAINKAREIRRGGQLDPKKQVPIKPQTEETRNPVAAIDKLKLALQESEQIRPTIEHARALERSNRAAQMEGVTTPGMRGHFERLGILKGELPNAQIMNSLDQSDVDSLIDGVTNSNLMPYQKINASVGLTKLLAGKPVAPYESKLLSQVYGDDLGQLMQLHGGIGLSSPNMKVVSDVVNLSRTLMSTMDVSAPFRQGLGLVHKKEFWNAYKDMFKYIGDEEAFQGLQEALELRPQFHLGEQSGLFLSDVGQNLSRREEQFLSGMVDKVPVIGSVKKGSERAYVGFLNKLRADTFDNLIDQAKKAGQIVEDSNGSPTKIANDIANFVNNASGRGDIGSLKKNADLINGVFFSPSLMASRLRLLNPKYYFDPKVSPIARKESLKSLLAIATAGSVVSGLLNQAGADVSLDPTSSDFGKSRFGNTRLDPFGGFQQYIVAASRLISGKTTTTSGKSYDLWESKYPNPNAVNVIGDFASSKESPIASFIHTLAQGEQAFPPRGLGEKLGPNKVSAEVINRFTPMIISDLTEIYEEDPDVLPLGLKVALGLGAASGMGVQRFKPKKSSPFRINSGIGAP